MVKSDESDDEAGKIFVGGLSWETTQEKLQEYFAVYGEVTDCVIMKNTETGKSRGFGFVTFKDVACVAKVLSSGPHEVDNRTIDPKVCNSKDSQQNKKSGQYPKIFLGGLPPNTTETDLRSFFSRYGTVVEVVLMYDQEKKKSRGFGFVSFETEDSCKRVCAEHFVKINGKKIECKHAEPRDKKRPAQQTGTAPQQWTGMGPSGWGPPGNTPSGSQGPCGPNMGPGVPGPMGPPMNNPPMMGPPGYQGGWGPGPYGAPGGWGPQPGYGPGYGWGYGPGYGPPGPGYGQPGYGGYGYGGYGYGGPMGGPPPPNPPAPGTENFPANSGGQNNNVSNNNNPNNPPAPNNNNGGNNNTNNNNNNPNSGNQPGQSSPGMGNYNQESSNFGPQRGQAFGPGYSGGSNTYGGSGNYPQNNYGNQGENQGNRSGGSQGNQGPGSHGYHPYHR